MFRVFFLLFFYCVALGLPAEALGSRVSLDPKPVKRRVEVKRKPVEKPIVHHHLPTADAVRAVVPAVQVASVSNTPTVSTAVSNTVRIALLRELELVRQSIQDDRHATALSTMQHLSDRLRAIQTDVIESFFPDTFQTLTPQGRPSLEYVSDRFGVIFSRRYLNPSSGQHLDVSVIHLDSSVQEYWDIVKNPKLAAHLDTAKIIEIQDGYRGLEKVNPTLGLIERNIVLSDSLMVNIVAGGKDVNQLILDYTRQVQFGKLKRYLQD